MHITAYFVVGCVRMQVPPDHLKTLNQLGLTFCEARVFLTLVHLGMCPAKMISKASNVSKPDVYRALASLQERALVEKVISSPNMFKTLPLAESLSILFNNKDKEHDFLRKKMEELKLSLKSNNIKQGPQETNQQFILIPGKEELRERRRKEIKNAQKSIDAITSWKRFPQTAFLYAEETEEALRKGVKVRFITEKNCAKAMSEYYRDVMKLGFYRIRYALDPPQAIFSIFDKKEVMIT